MYIYIYTHTIRGAAAATGHLRHGLRGGGLWPLLQGAPKPGPRKDSTFRKLSGPLANIRTPYENTYTYISAYMYILDIYTRTCISHIIYIYLFSCLFFVYVHVRIYIYIYVHVHTYIHTYMHTYIHTCIHTFIHTYMHTYIFIHSLSLHEPMPPPLSSMRRYLFHRMISYSRDGVPRFSG